MKWHWTENIYHYACGAKRRQTRNIPMIYPHAFRISKNKCLLFPYSLWNGIGQNKIYQYACKAKRRQTRYTPLIYLHAFRIRKKEKGNISVFLIRYETALDSKIFTIMLVRPKGDKGAIYQWSTFMVTENEILVSGRNSLCYYAYRPSVQMHYVQMPCLHVIRIRENEKGNE